MRVKEEVINEIYEIKCQIKAAQSRLFDLQEELNIIENGEELDCRNMSLDLFLKMRLTRCSNIAKQLSKRGIQTIGELLASNITVAELLALQECGHASVERFRNLIRNEFGYEFVEDKERMKKINYKYRY